MFKHILIATDGSAVSSKAARAGIALGKALGARITAYSAVEPLPMYGGDGYVPDQRMIDGFEKSAREAAQKRVDGIGKMAKAAGVAFASAVTNADTPYVGIIAAATKRKCDVIFMASHGRRGFSRLIMGSVTQKVLTHSRIPVVVYR
jgi:nucleotide-binding universal stress UspA family protein